METEFIREQRGGAVSVKFSDLSNEELRRMFWVFPEAKAEYTKRFVNDSQVRLELD